MTSRIEGRKKFRLWDVFVHVRACLLLRVHIRSPRSSAGQKSIKNILADACLMLASIGRSADLARPSGDVMSLVAKWPHSSEPRAAQRRRSPDPTRKPPKLLELPAAGSMPRVPTQSLPTDQATARCVGQDRDNHAEGPFAVVGLQGGYSAWRDLNDDMQESFALGIGCEESQLGTWKFPRLMSTSGGAGQPHACGVSREPHGQDGRPGSGG